MYISVHPSFQRDKTILKYSRTEIVDDVNEIDHIYFREVLKKLGILGVEISSTADIPAGTGLGSSSAFTVGLLHTLYSYNNIFISKGRLAEEACAMELQTLKQPIGKQDQYAAAYGGLNFYTFQKDGTVFVDPVLMDPKALEKLRERLMMFYVSGVRSASEILAEQIKNITSGEKEEKQKKICELTLKLRESLHRNDIDAVGEVLHESWMLKRSLASGITNPEIDRLYQTAIDNGATGGKLLGAGGGGFLLFYVPEARQEQVRRAFAIPQQQFAFDKQGSTIIYIGE
jgi:D-glycero-alpha-D-manno-heptose-7-phosphate kinase